MRFQNKYKTFTKLLTTFKEFPSRIIKFQRPKWKRLQILNKKTPLKYKKKYKLRKKRKQINSFIKLAATKRWGSHEQKYMSSIKLKKCFDCLFDKAFSILFLKNLKFLNKKLYKLVSYCVYLAKPEFRVDIFFWRLNFFSSCYEARRYINNNKIKVNHKYIHPNYFLKKGDVIIFDSVLYFSKNNFLTLLDKKLKKTKFFSFLLVDRYLNTVILLKDYTELSSSELTLFVSTFYDVCQFKTFIE